MRIDGRCQVLRFGMMLSIFFPDNTSVDTGHMMVLPFERTKTGVSYSINVQLIGLISFVFLH